MREWFITTRWGWYRYVHKPDTRTMTYFELGGRATDALRGGWWK